MKLSLNRFASVDLAWSVLLGLIVWLGLGMSVAVLPAFESGLREMNSLIVRDWLVNRAEDSPLVLGWLGALMLLAVLLGLNLLACLWQRLRQGNNTGRGLRFWAFWSIHFLAAVVMLLHGLDMALGKKYPPRMVQPGDQVSLGSAWSLQVHELHYVDDLELLELEGHQARQAMTRERFSMQANRVRISLLHHGRQIRAGEVKMLQPLIHGNTHVILRGFAGGRGGVQARLKVVQAPLHSVFFTSYALFILSFICWLVLCLRQPATSSGAPELSNLKRAPNETWLGE